jgi:hypothetical protein
MTPDENLQKPVGYLVYRSIDPDLPKSLWIKLTPDPIPDTNFKDTELLPGVNYYYYIVPVYSDGSLGTPSDIIVLSTDTEEDLWPDVIED